MGTKYANLHGSSVLSLSYSFAIATLSLLPVLSTSLDIITPTQPLTSNQTIVSAAAAFELGFFSPSNSQNWYLGIWYKQIPTKTIVWVANRDNPLTNTSSATLKISQDGNLVLAEDQFSQSPTWSSNFTAAPSNTVAQLLDDGNLVVRIENDDDPTKYLYQSFDHPTDTLLPGMKLGWDSKTGLNRMLTSWKGTDDPSTGVYSFKMDVSGLPEIFLWNGKGVEYRSGPWNGLGFSGVPEMNTTGALTFSFVTDANEVTYSFGVTNKSLYSRLIVNPSGVLQRFTWIDTRQVWNLFWYAPDDQCDTYKECGIWGVCDTNNNPVCECLKGFEPKNQQAWDLRDGSDGCVRVSGLECKTDGFLRLENMKLPDSSAAFVDRSMRREECEKKCRENCSCTAYASADIRGGGSGCVTWSEDLVDLRQYPAAEGGQELFVRVSAADSRGIGSKTRSVKAGEIVGITVGGGILLGLTILIILWKKKRKQRALNENPENRGSYDRSTQSHFLGEGVRVSKRDFSGERTTDELELPLFEFSTMAMATDNFCNENKLGQGGFGIVYKGLLMEGQEIAVKRLSKNSGQGVEEFKNEVKLIARLQHRNLVRLLGCCVEVEEKMLVYEYMENKSLDSILFNKEKCSLLDWQRRFNIICGIGRGLLYLHQDSRLRIIHRDLKASNILLDKEMNPKISDFGMARIFGGDQTEGDTMRVVGTYGYMAPEYAMDGHFSVKSDVFSFGVLVLEIVTGKKNRKFYSANQHLNLLGHAWKLWREGNGLELVDPSVCESYNKVEVLRCIQVGLLCVQERAEDRPTMSSVVLMLSSESTSLSQPKNPGFCLGRHHGETDSSSSRQDESCTLNNVTVTILDGR